MTSESYARPEADFRWTRVQNDLRRLASVGADEYWIAERAPSLLALRSVQREAGEAAGTQEEAGALIRILREIVSEFDDEPQGRLLRIVLALDPVWIDIEGVERSLLGMNLTQRRTLAGREFRGGRYGVGSHSIRLHHEPAAFRRLAAELIERELSLDDPGRLRVFEPGRRVPVAGLYTVCAADGAPLGRQVTLAKGERFPPVGATREEHGWRPSPPPS